MTIDELIEKLAQYPGDWEVVYDDYENSRGFYDIDHVGPGRIDPKWEFEYMGQGKSIQPNAVKLL